MGGFSFELWGAADANATAIYHNNGTGFVIQIDVIDQPLRKPQVRVEPFFVGPEEDDPDMRPRRPTAKIGQFLVSRHKPAAFVLHALPQFGVCYAAPALVRHSNGIVSMADKEVGNLVGQVLVS